MGHGFGILRERFSLDCDMIAYEVVWRNVVTVKSLT